MKIGDKVICIDNIKVERQITVGNVYTVIITGLSTFATSDGNVWKNNITLVNDNGYITQFYAHRFISLKELRKRKLNKICIE